MPTSRTMIFLSFLPIIFLFPVLSSAQRRTAPRRTTLPGGTYGTETFPTEPPTTPIPGETTEAGAAVQAPVHVAPMQTPVQVAPVAPQQMMPFGFPAGGLGGLPLPPQPAGFTPPQLPPMTMPAGFPASPFGAGILNIPGAMAIQNAVPLSRKPAPSFEEEATTTTTEASAADDLTQKEKVGAIALCEEVEEILPPGTTQEECFTGEPIQLRYWQPYRALRNIKCKYGANSTRTPPPGYKDQCAAAYDGAACIQRYQQFVILAAMGPAASGWSCVRLGSGCSCSVRNKKRLRITDYEQRTDLREFMKS